jgi:hypothetical protein
MWESFLRDGSTSGPFEVTSSDGTTVVLRYEARANTPWPGVHASVLGDASSHVDFDDALSAAGIVARYGLVPVPDEMLAAGTATS